MNKPVDSGFINVDIELHSSEDLAPLRAHFGDRVFELHRGKSDDGNFLAVESLVARKLVSDALRCTDTLLDLVDALPTSGIAAVRAALTMASKADSKDARSAPSLMLPA